MGPQQAAYAVVRQWAKGATGCVRRWALVALAGAILAGAAAGLPELGAWRRAVGAAEERARAALSTPPPPHVEAQAAVLMDLETGKLLYAKEAFTRFHPGALVKVVAAWVALKSGSPEETVVLDSRGPLLAAEDEGQGALGEGERVALGDLLRLMFYQPDANAAAAVAAHTAGSAAAFAALMNAEAERLGASSSRFFDATGTDPRSQTTAFDLALIAREALADPFFARMAGEERARLPRLGQRRTVLNVNSFLIRRPDATGVKSDYNPDVGFSLIGSVERGRARLLAVVIGSPSAAERYWDAAGLLDYGLAYIEGLRAEPRVPREPYQVREGDTLFRVANRFDVPVAAILIQNEIGDPDRLRAGDILWIPR